METAWITVDKCGIVAHRVAVVNRLPVSRLRDWIDPPQIPLLTRISDLRQFHLHRN